MAKKAKKTEETNEVGRPTLMTPETLKELEGAFADGASDKEACFLANISHQTLYNYQSDHPEFVERKEFLKNMVKFQAKKVIREAILNRKDVDTARWYADRKLKDEGFTTRNELTGKDGEQLVPLAGFEYVKPNQTTPPTTSETGRGLDEVTG